MMMRIVPVDFIYLFVCFYGGGWWILIFYERACVAQADIKNRTISLPQPPECKDYKPEPSD